MEERPVDPEQDRRVLIAVVLSIGLLWVFSNYVAKPVPQPVPAPVEETSDDDSPTAVGAAAPGDDSAGDDSAGDDDSASDAETTAVPGPAAAVAVRLSRSWNGVESGWSSFGGGPDGFRIAAYSEPFQQPWLPTWLWHGVKSGFEFEPFTLACPSPVPVDIVGDPDGVLLPVGVSSEGVAADTGHYELLEESERRLVFASRQGAVGVTKTYELPAEGHVISYSVEFRNLSARPVQVNPAFGVAGLVPLVKGDRYGSQMETWAEVDGDTEHMTRHKLDKSAPFSREGAVSWVALGDRYFMVGLEPDEPLAGAVGMHAMPGEDRFAAALALPAFELPAREARSYSFRLFAGPKELDDLNKAGLRMRSAVDFGFFGILALPILAFLKFLHGLVGSWGVSIILLTVAIKLLLYPLSQKSAKSMQEMKNLQPEVNALKERFKDDREAMNREMMALWKKHGVNPMGGCLPMLIQMPIWFALYRVLWASVELYQSPFLYFCDLSLRDPLGLLPLLLGISMWLMQKSQPTPAADPAQQAVMKFMPIFFSVIMFTLPVGLVVYILVNNVLSIGQQWLIQRKYGGMAPAVVADKGTSSGGKGKGKAK